MCLICIVMYMVCSDVLKANMQWCELHLIFLRNLALMPVLRPVATASTVS